MNKIKNIVRMMCVALLMLCCGCTSGDDTHLLPEEDFNTATPSYAGVWNIGHDSYYGAMKVDISGFHFSNVPVAEIMSTLLPESTIGAADITTFTVPFTLTGEGENALFYMLGDCQWRTTMTIDGNSREVVLGFHTLPVYTGLLSSTATYSRLSDVYQVVMVLTHCVIIDSATGEEQTFDTQTKITFITTHRTTTGN